MLPVTPEVWLAYTLAAAIAILIPGPVVIFMLSRAIAFGPRHALPCVLGVGAGDAIAMTVSFIGFGAAMAASAHLFTALKWIGAVYLLWLAWKMWRAPVAAQEIGGLPPAGSTPRAVLSAFTVTVLNPKGIAFFTAFVPQFVDPARPLVPQLVLFGLTFVALGTLFPALYVLFVGRIRRVLARPAFLRGLNRGGSVMLGGAGLMTATLQRT
jgi:threonine/homoserine/homoserine lactone efflux protein